jgi:hypothetical protein
MTATRAVRKRIAHSPHCNVPLARHCKARFPPEGNFLRLQSERLKGARGRISPWHGSRSQCARVFP